MLYSQKLNSTPASSALSFLTYSYIDNVFYCVCPANELIYSIGTDGTINWGSDPYGVDYYVEFVCTNVGGGFLTRIYDAFIYHFTSSGGTSDVPQIPFYVDSTGSIYNSVRNTIHINDPSYTGQIIVNLSDYSSATINNDGGFQRNVFDSSGNVFTNNNSNLIFKIDTSNVKTTLCTISGESSCIGLAIDSASKYLYTIGSSSSSLYKIDLSDGSYSVLAVLDQTPTSQYCIAISNSDLIYITYNTASDNIDQVDSSGTVTLYASASSPYNPFILGDYLYHLSSDSSNGNNCYIWYCEGSTPPPVDNYCIQGFAKLNGVGVENCMVYLFDQLNYSLVASQATDETGFFNFEHLGENLVGHVVVTYEDTAEKLHNAKSLYNIVPVNFPS